MYAAENSIDEEVFLPEDFSPEENGLMTVALIVGLREDMVALSRTLKTIQVR